MMTQEQQDRLGALLNALMHKQACVTTLYDTDCTRASSEGDALNRVKLYDAMRRRTVVRNDIFTFVNSLTDGE